MFVGLMRFEWWLLMGFPFFFFFMVHTYTAFILSARLVDWMVGGLVGFGAYMAVCFGRRHGFFEIFFFWEIPIALLGGGSLLGFIALFVFVIFCSWYIFDLYFIILLYF